MMNVPTTIRLALEQRNKEILHLDADGPDDPNLVAFSIPNVLWDVVVARITIIIS
jgi:hypothetical protein